VDIPSGTYPAKLIEITTLTSDAFGDFRRWDFKLENGSGVNGASSMNTGRKSKAGKWIAALLGRSPEKGEAVNVIGRACLVVVEEDNDGWPKVTNVLPPLAAPAPVTTPQPTELAPLP
jgi:hypothetical protein